MSGSPYIASGSRLVYLRRLSLPLRRGDLRFLSLRPDLFRRRRDGRREERRLLRPPRRRLEPRGEGLRLRLLLQLRERQQHEATRCLQPGTEHDRERDLSG